MRLSRLYFNRGFTRARLACCGWPVEASGVRASEFRFFLAPVGRSTAKGGSRGSSGSSWWEGGCGAVCREALLMLAARIFLPWFRLAVCWSGTSAAAHIEEAGGAAEAGVLGSMFIWSCVLSGGASWVVFGSWWPGVLARRRWGWNGLEVRGTLDDSGAAGGWRKRWSLAARMEGCLVFGRTGEAVVVCFMPGGGRVGFVGSRVRAASSFPCDGGDVNGHRH